MDLAVDIVWFIIGCLFYAGVLGLFGWSVVRSIVGSSRKGVHRDVYNRHLDGLTLDDIADGRWP